MQNNRIRMISLAALAAMLNGCASTEQLYAGYEHQCRVSIINNATAGAMVVDGASRETMLWEPAVYFNYDRADLQRIEQARLDADIAVLQRYPELKVNVRGFTDSIASQKYNAALAKRRVDSVTAYLMAAGIKVQRIVHTPLGESLPLAANDTYQSRAINRRVELLLLDHSGRAAPIRIDDEVERWQTPDNISQPGAEKDWNR